MLRAAMATKKMTPQPGGSHQFIAELAREGQLAQLQTIDGLDAKAANLIGFVGIVLGLILPQKSQWVLGMSALPLGQRYWPEPHFLSAWLYYRGGTSSTRTSQRWRASTSTPRPSKLPRSWWIQSIKDLEWSDSDSGDALVERADHLERTAAPAAHA